MAVPTAPSRTKGSSGPDESPSALLLILQKLRNSLGRPLIAVVLAIVLGGIMIIVTSKGTLDERFTAALTAYDALFFGAFGTLQNFSSTLDNMIPLILCGLSVSIAFRAGLFNIGAEGQLAMGAMTAGILGLTCSSWPGWLLIPVMILGGVLAGAIWGGLVGFLKAWRGAHEVVTTIMLNWIAFFFTDFLISGPFKAPQLSNQTQSMPVQVRLPRLAVFYNQTLGTFLPPIERPEQYFVDVSFLIAILVLVFYWFITARTTFGYQTKVVGQNPRAAEYAGISVKRNMVLAMALAGGFAGLAGALALMGRFPYQLIASVFRSDSTGFDAIGVSLLGHSTSIGVFLASLLFGALRSGGQIMQLRAGVPGDLSYIIQALILFSVATEFLPILARKFTRRNPFQRKLAVAGPAARPVTKEPPQAAEEKSARSKEE